MALLIKRSSESLYTAEATPPHSREAWKTPCPLELRKLIEALEQLGCHQRDIGDFLYEADPDWVTKLDHPN